jgi:choline dehydrogenase-like flavoprotein
MDLPAVENYTATTPDGVELRLARYRGGNKGPVLVAHGAGVWSGMFLLPTVDQPFAHYLVKNGYDAWLLDWRASIQLPLRQFTLDEAAGNDFPTAVRFIRERTRADSVQAVVHCAGASAFFMALAAGLLPDVRCVSCSQIALHYRVPPATEIKCMLNLGDVFHSLGVDYLSATEDPQHPLFQTLFGEMVDLIHHECNSTVCHRITFMYGHLYRHERLNTATHDRLAEQFGKCNMTAFRHLAQIVRRGSAARFDYGADENLRRYGSAEPPSYVRPEHLRIPITLVSGELNQCYLPVSTELTFNWLRSVNEPKLYRRHVVPGYGHIDNFMGANANHDCYPLFLEQLEACPA